MVRPSALRAAALVAALIILGLTGSSVDSATAGAVPNSADRLIVWTGCDDLPSLSNAELDAWRGRGVGGFVCMTGQLRGLGGPHEFTGDDGPLPARREFDLQRRLRDSRVVERLRDRGMKAYLGVYLSGYWNPRTPLAEWFDDRGWSETVLPRMGQLAAAAGDLGFAGVAFDQELYPTDGGVETATWDWRYPGVRRSERQVRAEARRRGREIMQSLLAEFPGVELMAYDVQLPGSWGEVVQREVNGRPRALDARLDVDFWDGLTSVDGYGAIRLADATFYKMPHLGSWDSALSYHYNSLFAELSRRLSNWEQASMRVQVSPFAWIDDGPCTCEWDDARSPSYVAAQLGAFRKWGMGGETAVYANRGLSGFDYDPYAAAMRPPAGAGVVDRVPPRLTVPPVPLRKARALRAGATLVLRGEVADNLAVRSVRWRTDGGRSGTAVLDWRPVAGDPRSGYEGRTTWRIRLAPRSGETRVVISAEDIKGLTSRRAVALARRAASKSRR